MTTVNTKSTKAAEVSEKSASSSTSKAEKSFKDELNTVKAQDNPTENTAKNQEVQDNPAENVHQGKNEAQIKASQKEVVENEIQNKDKKSAEKLGNVEKDPFDELSSKIASINNLKKTGIEKDFRRVEAARAQELSEKNDVFASIKMDKNDASFFLNLVQNQQDTVQFSQNNIGTQAEINFNNPKTEAVQKTVQVSQTLLDALSDSMKTGKSFRIDFDNNIAVIMRVDKNGVLSANFIPGDAAVENYLRNNMTLLQQNFDNQNLPYNSLSYSRQQKQGQEKQNQNQNKENRDE